jgi:hypothetical protein
MIARKIQRARALLHATAANDNFSAARGSLRAQTLVSARSNALQALHRFVRPIIVAAISACVVLWMSGAFLVGLSGIMLLSATLGGWHLLRRTGASSP